MNLSFSDSASCSIGVPSLLGGSNPSGTEDGVGESGEGLVKAGDVASENIDWGTGVVSWGVAIQKPRLGLGPEI